jgi:phosphorylcholine metabolism protein LicD
MKIRFAAVILLLLVLLLLLLTACYYTQKDRHTYFDEAVVVTYQQTQTTDYDDFVTLKFYENGSYEVYFAAKAEDCYVENIPQDFKVVVDETPYEHIVKASILPNYLLITIKKNGLEESHEFS